MTPEQPHQMLSARAELGELVFGALRGDPSGAPLAGAERDDDPLLATWEYAADEAQAAYELWRQNPGAEAYAVYRACADRADAAQDVLAARG